MRRVDPQACAAPRPMSGRLSDGLVRTPRQVIVTAEEIHIETYFPADDATEATLRALR